MRLNQHERFKELPYVTYLEGHGNGPKEGKWLSLYDDKQLLKSLCNRNHPDPSLVFDNTMP